VDEEIKIRNLERQRKKPSSGKLAIRRDHTCRNQMPFCTAGWFSGGSYMYQVLSKLSGLELWPVGGGGSKFVLSHCIYHWLKQQTGLYYRTSLQSVPKIPVYSEALRLSQFLEQVKSKYKAYRNSVPTRQSSRMKLICCVNKN